MTLTIQDRNTLRFFRRNPDWQTVSDDAPTQAVIIPLVDSGYLEKNDFKQCRATGKVAPPRDFSEVPGVCSGHALKRQADSRRIPTGTRLALVSSLMGDCEAAWRTVVGVRSADILVAVAGKDEPSYLTLGKAQDFEPTRYGFKIKTPEGETAAEYILGD